MTVTEGVKVELLKQNGYSFLWIDGVLWMYDIPSEVEAQKYMANQAYGNTLVAGYGLGIVQKFLCENKSVSYVTTIEKYSEVIDAVIDANLFIQGDVQFGDFYDYDEIGEKFDCVIGDIWKEILPIHLDEYLRFKDKAVKLLKPDGKIIAWGQEFFEYLIERS